MHPRETMTFSDMFLARKLKLYQLVVFNQVVRDGSMVHAAQTLNLTQPAVSKIVHELEAYFDAQLLIRGNRGVKPTELGTLVLTRAKSVLRELRALGDEVHGFLAGTFGHVVVGSLISASRSLLPSAIKLLKQSAPDIMVSLQTAQIDQLFPALVVGDLDLVVCRIPDDWHSRDEAADLKVEALYEQTISIVADPEHPLQRQTTVTLADMHPFPWILPTRESLFRRTVDRLFAEADLGTPVNVVESLSILTNLSLIGDRQTISLMPSETAQQFAGTGLLSRLNYSSGIRFGEIGCFFQAKGPLKPPAQRFLECLRTASHSLSAPPVP